MRIVAIAMGLAIVAAIGIAGALYLRGGEAVDLPLPMQVGTIESPDISESSGVAASRRFAGIFWTHNDRGNDSSIYAITREGRLVAKFEVDAKNGDWEDIALDDAGNLYIGKIGNNDAKKDTAEVLRIREPDPRANPLPSSPLKVEQSWRLKYPGKPFDAEGLFVHGDAGYLVSKVTKGKQPSIYRFDLTERKRGKKLAMQEVVTLPTVFPVSAADISPDGQRLAILTSVCLEVYRIDGDVSRAGEVEPLRYPVHSSDMEGCCFVPGGILTTSESRRVCFFPDPGSGNAASTAQAAAE